MLASDLMNPMFVGAHNPDERLQATFHWQEVKTMFGKPVLDKDGKAQRTIYVKIEIPGDTSSVVDTPMRPEHKKRFPRQFMEFQANEGLIADSMDIPGWSIDSWTELDESLRRELKYLRFSTVEQIAGASDAQIQRVGAAGPGLRIKARAALAQRMDAGVKAEIEARDKKISELESKLDRLLNAMERRMVPAASESKVEALPQKEKKPRGRPKKQTQDAAQQPQG